MRLSEFFPFFLLLLLPVVSYAQGDTVYYDHNWEITDSRNAEIYRVSTFTNQKLTAADHYLVNEIDTNYDFIQPGLDLINYTNTITYISYTKKGIKLIEGSYQNNKMTGAWKYYYPNTTQIWHTEKYADGKIDGELLSYYRDGKLKRREMHKINDTTVTGKCYDRHGDEIKFTLFTVLPKPTFDLSDFLQINLHYPEKAREKDIEGKVIVKFYVGEDGSIYDVKVLKGIGGGCDEEAVRVLSMMPKWTKGIVDDKISKVYFKQPIMFRLE